jgi:hypothetical protein
MLLIQTALYVDGNACSELLNCAVVELLGWASG